MIRAEDRMWTGLVHRFGPFGTYCLVVALLYAGCFASTTMRSPHDWFAHLAVGAIMAGSAVGLMWIARWVWRREGYATLRAIAAGAIGYHALFGVAVLLWRAVPRLDADESALATLWPHVVHAINSLE